MTHNPKPDVTDADREAAANLLDELSTLLDHNGIGQVADLIRDGEYDKHEATTAFVRHRLATEARMALTALKMAGEAVEAERERCAMLYDAAQALQMDMVTRAEMNAWQHDGELVVEAGTGVWARFGNALAAIRSNTNG